MGKRGRKPLSAEEHAIRGNYRPDKHGPLLPESRVTFSAPAHGEPPEELEADARKVWVYHYEMVTRAGLITRGELELFTQFCIAAGMARFCARKMKEVGWWDKYKSDSTDGKKGEDKNTPNKWVKMWREAAHDVARLGSLLGLTPTDRSRIVKANPSEAPAPVSKVRPRTALDKAGPIRIAEGA